MLVLVSPIAIFKKPENRHDILSLVGQFAELIRLLPKLGRAYNGSLGDNLERFHRQIGLEEGECLEHLVALNPVHTPVLLEQSLVIMEVPEMNLGCVTEVSDGRRVSHARGTVVDMEPLLPL